MSLIKLKKSSVPGRLPQAADLEYGEIAINYADGQLYYKKTDGTIQSIGGGGVLGTRKITESTATSGQTTFTVSGGYTVGFNSKLKNNEWIIYDKKQFNIRYLVEFE